LLLSNNKKYGRKKFCSVYPEEEKKTFLIQGRKNQDTRYLGTVQAIAKKLVVNGAG
jgi:hypothetical protein